MSSFTFWYNANSCLLLKYRTIFTLSEEAPRWSACPSLTPASSRSPPSLQPAIYLISIASTCFNSTQSVQLTPEENQPNKFDLKWKIGHLGSVQHLGGSLAACLLDKMVIFVCTKAMMCCKIFKLGLNPNVLTEFSCSIGSSWSKCWSRRDFTKMPDLNRYCW